MTEKDYGCDPVGDGTYKMVPSGDIVSAEERDRRLPKREAPCNDIFGMSWDELEAKQGGRITDKPE